MQKFHVVDLHDIYLCVRSFVPLPITQDWVFCREAYFDFSQFVYVLLLLMIPLTGIFFFYASLVSILGKLCYVLIPVIFCRDLKP